MFNYLKLIYYVAFGMLGFELRRKRPRTKLPVEV